jgi:hypothetical protein
MDMMTLLTEWLVRAVDFPLGWLMSLPRDVGLLVFAAGTALVMTLARRMVTDQDLLRRCAADLRQLKRLTGESRKEGDKQRLGRLRATAGLIKGMQLAADLRVLAAVLVPVAILAVWASERFNDIPPRVGEPLVVRASFPASSIDRVTHLVPSPDLELDSTAIQIIRSDGQSPPMGTAEWTVRPTDAGEFPLTIRHQGESVVHRVVIGRTWYRTPVQPHGGERLTRTEVVLERYRPLGSNLGSDWTGLPPWMMGYLILTLVLVPVIKRGLRVA